MRHWACSTVCRDHKGLTLIVTNAILQKGVVTSSVDDSILTLKWKDKRDVLMLSTYSMVTKTRRTHAAVGGVENIEKPQVVGDYNQSMGGVDKSKLLLCV